MGVDVVEVWVMVGLGGVKGPASGIASSSSSSYVPAQGQEAGGRMVLLV